MRYAIALLALLVALAVIPQGDAGVLCDSDNDGAGDCTGTGDNCSVYPNGPLAQDPETPHCDSQLDGDMDGYGNPCDSDVDNDFAASLVDVSLMLQAATVVSTDPNFDLDCDGAASLADLSRTLADATFVLQPGPSGYACAGQIPCP